MHLRVDVSGSLQTPLENELIAFEHSCLVGVFLFSQTLKSYRIKIRMVKFKN